MTKPQIDPGSPAALDYVHDKASALIREAEQLGVILTIERVPVFPLAMRNAVSLAEVRAAR